MLLTQIPLFAHVYAYSLFSFILLMYHLHTVTMLYNQSVVNTTNILIV